MERGAGLKELDTDDEMPRPRIVHAFSAGGVVFRVTTMTATAPLPGADPSAAQLTLDGVEVVLVGFLRDNTWTLPKGTPTIGETVEETALREVREETGVQARIVDDLGSIQYSFARRGVRFNKEVRHFLMKATGGDVALHDAEYDEARWFALAEAVQRLTYQNEVEVMRRAQPLIGKHLVGDGL
jgi:ADP-ribose pyrophosphatase YjhB (NUDIX family)